MSGKAGKASGIANGAWTSAAQRQHLLRSTALCAAVAAGVAAAPVQAQTLPAAMAARAATLPPTAAS